MKWLIILIIAAVWMFSLYGDIRELKSELYVSQSIYNHCSDRLIDYQDALQEANDNIENAQSYAWSNYYDMGYALDDLQTVDEP